MNALAKASVKLHYLFWEVSRIYPVARNFRERFSLLWFFLMFHMCYHVPSFFRGRDATIRIQGAKYIVGLGTEEIGTFKELYCDQIYEMVAEFVPKHGWIVI